MRKFFIILALCGLGYLAYDKFISSDETATTSADSTKVDSLKVDTLKAVIDTTKKDTTKK